jgi:Carboxylesterase family
MQNLKQIESECLNLNITCPSGMTRESRLPVMVWIHGCAYPHARSLRNGPLTSPVIIVEAIAALDLIGSMMEAPLSRIVSG